MEQSHPHTYADEVVIWPAATRRLWPQSLRIVPRHLYLLRAQSFCCLSYHSCCWYVINFRGSKEDQFQPRSPEGGPRSVHLLHLNSTQFMPVDYTYSIESESGDGFFFFWLSVPNWRKGMISPHKESWRQQWWLWCPKRTWPLWCLALVVTCRGTEKAIAKRRVSLSLCSCKLATLLAVSFSYLSLRLRLELQNIEI